MKYSVTVENVKDLSVEPERLIEVDSIPDAWKFVKDILVKDFMMGYGISPDLFYKRPPSEVDGLEIPMYENILYDPPEFIPPGTIYNIAFVDGELFYIIESIGTE